MRHAHILHDAHNFLNKVVDVRLGIADLENRQFVLLAIAGGAPLEGDDVRIVHVPPYPLQRLQRGPELKLSQKLMLLNR